MQGPETITPTIDTQFAETRAGRAGRPSWGAVTELAGSKLQLIDKDNKRNKPGQLFSVSLHLFLCFVMIKLYGGSTELKLMSLARGIINRQKLEQQKTT